MGKSREPRRGVELESGADIKALPSMPDPDQIEALHYD